MATENKFKRVCALTLPVLKLEKGKTRYLAFLGAMHTGKAIGDKPAATLLHSLDMETGEEGTVIVPAVMQSELNDGYPGDAYVGRGFEVTITRVPEKRYNLVSIAEVTIPDDVQRTVDNIRAQLSGRVDKPADKPKK